VPSPTRRGTDLDRTWPARRLQTTPCSPPPQQWELGVLSHLSSTNAAPTRAPASWLD